MRKLPSHIGSPPPVTPKKDDTIITQIREYELITPLFGGGVAPSEADPVTVIRGTEIRGQLRFWWRACRSGNKGLNQMKEAEDKLWGAAAKKDDSSVKHNESVQISLEVTNPGTAVKPFNVQEGDRRKKVVANTDPVAPPAYAAFPMQPTDKDLQKPNLKLKEVRSNITFKLTITFPTYQREEVEAALWAWETFGGLGARTRRGFGALHLLKVNGKINDDLPPADIQGARQWLQTKLANFVSDGTAPKDVPHLSKNAEYKFAYPSQNGYVAWKQLIRRLSSFRQIPDGRQGKSLWPEAEAIRQGLRSDASSGKFPRAAFGLPIVFHFKDQNKGEPKDTTLQGAEKGKERLASPLILRPLGCQNNRAIGLAIILDGPRIPPSGVVFVEEDSNTQHPANTLLRPDEARRIPPLKGESDVLKAFLNYL